MAKLLGLVALERKLKRLPEVAKTKIKKAMEQVADEIVAMMKSLVPVDEGTLRDSIGWTWGRPPSGTTFVAKVKSTIGDELTITIYAGSAEAYQARWIEFGVQPHSTRKGADISRNKRQTGNRQHPGSRAQPFFFVSWRANRKTAKRKIGAATRAAAREVAQRG
ncbi:MAG: HK97 gp10 family phage protein [Parvibaculaceae bacterium]